MQLRLARYPSASLLNVDIPMPHHFSLNKGANNHGVVYTCNPSAQEAEAGGVL